MLQLHPVQAALVQAARTHWTPIQRCQCHDHSSQQSFAASQEPGLITAAEQAWDLLASHPATAAAAGRMAAQVAATPARAAARLGRSGWNAYSFNVDYRTGASCSTWRCASSYACV